MKGHDDIHRRPPQDEQGLGMGEMLTVKFRQPSHDFTFGVGITFIPYPLVITPLV
jgi:hypothetical protein